MKNTNISTLQILGITFVILKLLNVIACEWYLVILPFVIRLVLLFACAIVMILKK